MQAEPGRSRLAINLIGASAGTGKTHRLACAFVDAVTGRSEPPVDPAKIMALTFTNKAADELLERVRHIFISRGHRAHARNAACAYIGTINAICGQLLKEHAFEAGLSPIMNVIPAEEVSNILAMAADRAVEAAADDIEDVAHRLSFSDWRETVERIAGLARANAVSLSDFDLCIQRSWESLQLLLPAPTFLPPEELDRLLLVAIDTAIAKLETVGDDSKTTLGALSLLKEKRAAVRAGRLLAWNEWAQLSKLTAAKTSIALVRPVTSCASNHAKHPRLHSDVRDFIMAIFNCSRQVIEEYEAFKRVNGFVDFTDQEYLTLNLLNEPNIRERIPEKIELILVDEFQDTSPIQLAIFSKLARLVKRSLWVGDEKQAIYGFRGTDPELMNGVVHHIDQTSGSREQLEKSFRSRPSLIQFTNDVFGISFKSTGIPEEHVRITSCDRAEDERQPNGLMSCRLPGKGSTDAPGPIAEFIEEILANGAAWSIVDKFGGELRPIVGKDIAVLCRTNERCEAVANALSQCGVKSAYARNGLLQTTECVLSFAALRYLVERNDSLAMAEIMHLCATDEHQYEWLNQCLANDKDALRTSSSELVSLDQIRARLMHATPSEALEAAMSAVKAVEFAKRWGNARTRLSNLDALRGLGKRFEDICLRERRSATPAGLVTFLFREVRAGGEQPASMDSTAVQVLTYHSAKGLEYPMVILLDLDTPKESSPFGIFAETAGGKISADDPLKERWIRFWPWPYGQQKANVYLDGAADGSAEMIAARKQDRSENMRLLYVGCTRARDYLVLGCTKNTGWLDSLIDARGARIITLPVEPGEHFLRVGDNSHKIAVSVREPANVAKRPASGVDRKPTYTVPDAIEPASRPALRMQPSALTDRTSKAALVDIRSLRVHNLGSRFPFTATPDMQCVGDAMHAYLAWDLGRPVPKNSERLEVATRLLKRWQVAELEPQYLLDASDRLRHFLELAYPSASISNECAVFGKVNEQRIHGRIDLLLKTAAGIVIIDHKTFPGAYEQWIARAAAYRPQLAMYADLACRSTGLPMRGLLVHLPIVGVIVDVTVLPVSCM